MKTWKTPAPLYEDPIFAGPSDPCVIRNQETGDQHAGYGTGRSAAALRRYCMGT